MRNWAIRRLAPIKRFYTLEHQLKPSTFTGKAQFYETLFFLDDVYLKVKDAITSSTSAESSSSSFQWLTKERMQDKLGFEMSLLEYRQIRQRLNKIVPAAQASSNVAELLEVFNDSRMSEIIKKRINASTFASNSNNNYASASNNNYATSTSNVDAFGRVTAIGKRKSSVAKVTIIPGSSGECRVNGRAMIEYFPRFRDWFEISKPLGVVRQFGKFNIWAMTRGGGFTGQSGAIKLALARALAVYNAEWKAALDAAGLLKRDIRRVERKKPGQEKARKKFTWVKR